MLGTKLKLFDLSYCGLPDNLDVYVIVMLQDISLLFPIQQRTYNVSQEGNLCQFVLKSIRTHFGQFVLKMLVNSYSFGQFVLIWSIRTHVWSVRTHFGQFVLILVNSYSNSSEYKLTKMSTN